MKKLVFMVGFLGLFLYSGALVEAADIQAQLADIDGTSAFSVLSSTPTEVGYIDSAGNASFNGDLTVGDEAVVKGGMRIDSGGTQNITAETLIVDGKIGIIGTGLTSAFNVGASDQFQVGSDGDLDSIKGVAYSWPIDDGTASQFLQSDGIGTLTWATPTAAPALTVSGATAFGPANSPTAWTDLDLSGIVGTNSAFVILNISATADMEAVAVRMNGDTAEYWNAGNEERAYGCALAHHDSTSDVVLICVTDSNGVIEWRTELAKTATVTVIAYIK